MLTKVLIFYDWEKYLVRLIGILVENGIIKIFWLNLLNSS